MRALLTGFDIFKGEKKNPSWEAIKDFNKTSIFDVEIIIKKLPVEFKKVIAILPDLITSIMPDIYIGFGLASRRATINVERVAINIMDSKLPDNAKYAPEDEPIFEDGPVAYFSTLPIKQIIENLRKEGIPAIVSNSAGTYVCNTAFYVSRHTIEKNNLDAIAGFIHLPYQSDQVVDKNVPSFPLSFIIQAVNVILQTSIAYIKDIKSSR